jgi:prolyl oligopeptidase
MRSMKRARMAISCRLLSIVLGAGLAVACHQQVSVEKIAYPPTAKGDVSDDYFGTKVADPYRWMEDLNSKDVADWIAAQNKVTSAYLEKLPLREHFRKRITELWDYPRVDVPVHEGDRYFFEKNTGLQRQPVLYQAASLTASPSVVIDPNALWPDGSTSLAQWSPSPDGRLLAWGRSEGGADWEIIKVRDVATGIDMAEELDWVRFSGLSWTRDNKGFFYSRYPAPPAGKVRQAALANQTLYYHRIGTPQSADTLIYARKDLPSWFVSGSATEDGRYLFIWLQKGADNSNRLYYADLKDPQHPQIGAPIKALFEEDGAEFSPFGNKGSLVFLRTDRQAPHRKVLALDLAHPSESDWKTIVPEGKDAIEAALFIGGRVVLHYLADVQSKVSLFGADGQPQGELPLPGTGSVTAIQGREELSEILYSFTSPLVPTTVYAYEPSTKAQTPFQPPKAPIDTSKYETRAAFATSKDGTRVPVFISMRKGLALDGSHPTMLYGYGGFAVSLQPTYRSDVPAWLEAGGIWVTANMRGGAEYGEAWHKAGSLANKQNVFDDFIAAAEYLIREKYTSPAKLGIMGGSNGGLLVGAVEQQRPDLFAVALPAVGVMDMLRFDRFTGGEAWVIEYGSSKNAKDFPVLLKYSPLQNAKPGTCYPATLVTTADFDDRVVPSHSFKFTAAMQAAQGCDKPILIRVEDKASHGYRPTDKRIAELVDEWSFAAQAMGKRTVE